MKAIHKSSFAIFSAVIALFSALAVVVARNTSSLLAEEAERTVRGVVRETAGRIDRSLMSVEAVVRNLAWVVGEHLDNPDYMYRITQRLVEDNELVVGSAIAFEPNFFKERGRLFAPYSCASTNGQLKSFPLPYDYSSREWYVEARRSGKARWCEPYFDHGGGGVMMCTFSVPVKDDQGRVYAILTADIALAHITELVKSICPYPNSYAVMISPAGHYLVLPPQGRTCERDVAAITLRERTQNGWVVSVVCPMENILSDVRKMVRQVVMFAAVGLLIVILVSLAYASRS